eukprot:s2442_g12.t1
MMIAGKERGKAKAKAKAKVKAKALSACLPNFPMACRRPLVGCRFALIIILAAVSGRSPMASAIVACMCVALKDVHEPANSSDSPSAEEFAASLLGKWIEQADVLKLFDCLPQSAPQRGGGGGTSFATGAFAKVKVGLRGNVAVFPKTTEALAAFVRQSAPAHKFTTIVVFDSVLTTPHRDQQNSFLPNLAVPVSSFTQGSIWVQSDNGPHARMIDGAELRGVAWPVSDGPVLFDARRSLRLTDAWSGRRVVLVAFSMSAIDKLSPDAAARLTALRFALPSPDDVEHFRRLSPAYLSKNTEASFTSVMRLLGFKIADDKDKPFSVRSETLGVIVDTSDVDLERVSVSNKPSRSQAISQAIEQILLKRQATPRELPALFGRLQFAEAQILGRMGRLALRDLRNLERSPAAQVNLTSQHLEALMLLKERVLCGPPRSVSATQASRPIVTIVIFTDGCFEPGSDVPAGVGGVMFSPTSFGSVQVRAFGAVVPSMLLETWHAKGRRHLIGQVEMYAVLLARSCWANMLDGSRVIFFVDHSGVLAACISGSSKEETWRKLLCALEKANMHPALQWFSRVPSRSNISDGPSKPLGSSSHCLEW